MTVFSVFFHHKKKTSGSGDPYGIRRISLSLIKILTDNKLDLDLFEIFNYCKKLNTDQKIQSTNDNNIIVNFLNKRIEVFFTDEGYKAEIIKSCLKQENFSPYLILRKAKSLSKFLNSKIGINFMKAFKRLNSITENRQKNFEIDVSLLKKSEEVELFETMKGFKNNTEGNPFDIDEDSYDKLSNAINLFLDNIMVNAKEDDLRMNRKTLLAECKDIVSSFFNFTILQIDE